MRLPAFALPALAAALALLFVIEWLLPAPGGAAPDHRLEISAMQSGDAANAAVSQWGGTALARPLFQPGRRPVRIASGNTDTSLPRLSAIIIIGNSPVAVFSPDGQKPQLVRAGGEIAGYRLEHIGPDKVELAGPDGRLTLHPQYAKPQTQSDMPDASGISEESN